MNFFWRQVSVGLVHVVTRRNSIEANPQVVVLATWEPYPSLYRLADETFTDEEIEAIRVQFTEPNEDTEIGHLRELVATLRREVQDLLAATKIVAYDIGGEYVALAGRRGGTGFGESVNEAIGDLIRSHPSRFNIKITEKPE